MLSVVEDSCLKPATKVTAYIPFSVTQKKLLLSLGFEPVTRATAT